MMIRAGEERLVEQTRRVVRAHTGAKIIGNQTDVFFANVKSKGKDVISCKGAETSPICIAGLGQGGEQEALGRGDVRYVRRVPAKRYREREHARER